MSRFLSLLLSLPGFLLPLASIAEDLIKVQTSLYELDSEVSETATQDELAAMAGSVCGNLEKLRLATVAITSSGKWATTAKTKEFYFPESYGETRLIQSKSGNHVYSIEATSETENADSLIIPGEPEDFVSRELGTTVKVKPTLRSDGTIQLEGTVKEVTLVDLALRDQNPVITLRKANPRSKARKVADDFQKTPVFSTAETAFSSRISPGGAPHYSVIKLKRSCLSHSAAVSGKTEPAPTGIQTVRTLENEETSYVTIFPAKPDEVVTVLIESRAKTLTPVVPSSSEKGDQVYVIIRFVESDQLIDIETPVMDKSHYESFIRTLNQQRGVDVLTAPSIMLAQGNRGKVEVVREFIFPTSYDGVEFDPESIADNGGFPITPATPAEFKTDELGVTVTMTARIQADGNISLNAESLISEFEGFINYSSPVVAVTPNGLGKRIPVILTENRILAPVFSLRKQSSSAVIPNGGTWVMGNVSDTEKITYEDSGPLGLIRKKTVETKRRQVIALITATRYQEESSD